MVNEMMNKDKQKKRKYWLWGGVIGLIYSVISILIQILLADLPGFNLDYTLQNTPSIAIKLIIVSSLILITLGTLIGILIGKIIGGLGSYRKKGLLIGIISAIFVGGIVIFNLIIMNYVSCLPEIGLSCLVLKFLKFLGPLIVVLSIITFPFTILFSIPIGLIIKIFSLGSPNSLATMLAILTYAQIPGLIVGSIIYGFLIGFVIGKIKQRKTK